MSEVAPILYHGKTTANAHLLLQNGWKPHQVAIGVNNGRPGYLYLSTDRVDALFYGHMNDEDHCVVLALTNVPLAALAVDPEDSQTPTVKQELAHSQQFPGRVVLIAPLPAGHFSEP